MPSLDAVLNGLRRRRHTALLVAIGLALAARPVMGEAGRGPIVFSLGFLTVMLVALYTIQVDDLVGQRGRLLVQRRRRRVAGVVLAAAAIAARFGLFVAPSPRFYIVGTLCWLLFIAFVTWSLLRSLVRQKEITNETISMSIAVYLLLGLTWGLVYVLIFQVDPQAFSFGSPAEDAEFHAAHPDKVFPVLIYFSLVTLATVGYGHIYPISLQARYIAVAEGITGQFFLAVLVARLVGMQMSRAIEQDRDRS